MEIQEYMADRFKKEWSDFADVLRPCGYSEEIIDRTLQRMIAAAVVMYSLVFHIELPDEMNTEECRQFADTSQEHIREYLIHHVECKKAKILDIARIAELKPTNPEFREIMKPKFSNED